MTKKVITIDADKTVFDASNIYKDKKVGSLIVIKDGSAVGMITERDIIERTICMKRDPEKTKVKDIMSRDLISIHALVTIEEALDVMREKNIKKLPVIVDNEIVGIITATDISRARPELSKRFIESWIKPEWID